MSLLKKFCRWAYKFFGLKQGFGCVLDESYGTNLGERFAAAALEKYYETAVQPLITNTDYEKLVSAGGASKFSVLTFGDLTMQDYTKGSGLNRDTPTESEGELDPDQHKAFYFEIDNLAKFESYVKNPETALVARATSQFKEAVDTYVLGLYADVGSGNRVGGSYISGSVYVVATTGACTETTSTAVAWASSMTGLGFKGVGHSKWYRIQSVGTASILTLMNDSDDDDKTYDGGELDEADYEIEAATVHTATSSNIDEYVSQLAEKLDESKVPKEDRWLVVNAKCAAIIKRSSTFSPAVETAYQDVVKKGLIGEFYGLKIYQNEQVAGNNRTGYYFLAGHKSAITFAMEYKESGMVENIPGEFGRAYKGLIVYGAKILDERRRALAYLWATIS